MHINFQQLRLLFPLVADKVNKRLNEINIALANMLLFITHKGTRAQRVQHERKVNKFAFVRSRIATILSSIAKGHQRTDISPLFLSLLVLLLFKFFFLFCFFLQPLALLVSSRGAAPCRPVARAKSAGYIIILAVPRKRFLANGTVVLWDSGRCPHRSHASWPRLPHNCSRNIIGSRNESRRGSEGRK